MKVEGIVGNQLFGEVDCRITGDPAAMCIHIKADGLYVRLTLEHIERPVFLQNLLHMLATPTTEASDGH